MFVLISLFSVTEQILTCHLLLGKCVLGATEMHCFQSTNKSLASHAFWMFLCPSSEPKMKALCSSEMLTYNQNTTWHNNSEQHHLQSYCHQNQILQMKL
jgi:hypothetical protein